MNNQGASSTEELKPESLDIIVAEDDAHDQMLLVMAAKDGAADVEFTFAGDGEELLDLLRERHKNGLTPDLVVLDMRMPRLDGHEVLDALANNPELRPRQVGVFSSSHREQDIQQSIQKGAAWHRVKPSRFEDLVGFVAEVTAECLAAPAS